MPGHIIDSRKWSKERLRFLQGLLDDEHDEARRKAIEAEMETLRQSTSVSRGRLSRWLSAGRVPPEV